MTKFASLLGTAAVLLGLPVFALPVVAQSAAPQKTAMIAALGVSPASQEFAIKAAASDIAQIEASSLAVLMAKNDKSKAFAAKMIKDYTEMSNELEALASSDRAKVHLPREMGQAHWDKVSRLQSLAGPEFVKEYNQMQVAEHKASVLLFERYAKSGDNAELKAFAARYLPLLQDHLKMAQDLSK